MDSMTVLTRIYWLSDAQLVTLLWHESGTEESQLGNMLECSTVWTGIVVDRAILAGTKLTIVHRCERLDVVVKQCVAQRFGYLLLLESERARNQQVANRRMAGVFNPDTRGVQRAARAPN